MTGRYLGSGCGFAGWLPEWNGNGRMSRSLTTLLLYRSGFYVGKYISLEAKIAGNKDFEDRFSIVEEKMPAIDMVLK